MEIQAPAGFVPQHAISFAATGGEATLVGPAQPLPVTPALAAANSAPLAGTTNSPAMIGPFSPDSGRPIWLTLTGDWSGSVVLLRSRDGGATKLPLTYSDGSPKGSCALNVNAPIAQEPVTGATYYLDAMLSSGTLAYRMEQ
jgi:hypothetical protein